MKKWYRNYFEICAFTAGLLLLALMDPSAGNGASLCLFDLAGFSYCPGDGLGHSISYFFRGEFSNSLEAHILGPLAIFIIVGRIIHLQLKNHKY